jgi:glycosyltransferase involved in cell wall biosynthesis
MRIVIDMQGAQIESRFRDIGRYTLSFAKAVARNSGQHEIILALSGLLPKTIEPIRAAFEGLLPQKNIRVWHALGPVREVTPGHENRRVVAELIREAFLSSLRPDIVHIGSLFDGYVDDVVTSIGRFDCATPVTVTAFEIASEGGSIVEGGCWKAKLQTAFQAAACFVAAEDGFSEIIPHVPVDEFQRLPIASKGDWDKVAANVLSRWESIAQQADRVLTHERIEPSRRPRLAYVSPLPPERTGIADYSAEMLPALAEYYEIDVVVAQDHVADSRVSSHLPVRDVAWLKAHASQLDRVLYHIGNSAFHAHMLPLLAEVPGTVVLHDLYLGHLVAWMDDYVEKGSVQRVLYSNHGYLAVQQHFQDPRTAIFCFPCSFEVIKNANGVIVHSEHSRRLARDWYGNTLPSQWSVIPLPRASGNILGKGAARRLVDFSNDDFLVCSFGFIGETKLNHRLLQCWLASALARDRRCHLIFVGEYHCGEYSAQLLKLIRRSGVASRVRITGFVSPEQYRQYLLTADLAVQLRTRSRGETSAAVLDCMNYALPVVANANGSMAELDHNAIWMLPDEFDDAMLIEALETLWREPGRRSSLGKLARAVILDRHSPAICAKHYAEAIERFYRRSDTGTGPLTRAIARHLSDSPGEQELVNISKAIATTFPLPSPAKRLFLDVTATCRDDLKTGIERTARALLLALLQEPPTGFRGEPVYLDHFRGEWVHRNARRYTLGLLGCRPEVLDDEIIEPESGDILLLLDLSGEALVQAQKAGLFADYRNRGVAVHSIVFDLLPIRLPHMFPPGADHGHRRWLESICEFDGALGISKAVADDLAQWQVEVGVNREDRRPFRIGWLHLGADVGNTAPTCGLPEGAESQLAQLRVRPSFLMVGTIEPRKGYLETIEAFTQLWADGIDVNLVIVGKEGWIGLPENMRRNIPETARELRNHAELHKHLFWLEGISDEYLEAVYGACACLIAASYGEGFGLPLIEAAQHKLPIIARDIPIFREVAEEYAYYFDGRIPNAVGQAVRAWLELFAKKQHPKSYEIPWLTWRQSAAMLMGRTLG